MTHTAEEDATRAEEYEKEALRLMSLANSHSWYQGDGDLPRVNTIIAAAQVYATLAVATRVVPPGEEKP